MNMMRWTSAIIMAFVSYTASCAADTDVFCDDFARLPETYNSIASGMTALAAARVCVVQYTSAADVARKHQLDIEEELKKDPQSLSLIRLKAKTVVDGIHYENRVHTFLEKANAIQKSIEQGSLRTPGDVIKEQIQLVLI